MSEDAEITVLKDKFITNTSYSLDKARGIVDRLGLTEGYLVDRVGAAYNFFNMMKDEPENITVENALAMNKRLYEIVDLVQEEAEKRGI